MIPVTRWSIGRLVIFTVFTIHVSLPVHALSAQDSPTADCPRIKRRLPPTGLEIPPARRTAWMARIEAMEARSQSLEADAAADVTVLLKACRFAIEFQELYRQADFAKIDRLLDLAESRLDSTQWTAASGLQVRGFNSHIDGAPQPVGLLLPEGWREAEKLPLYVWLHGRGDKNTDLHFICERLDEPGQIAPPGAIVLHPFGRHCVGYKSAGEIDVLEAIDFTCSLYPVDEQRIVLMGFSMGGAGVWHLAAHYGERFVAASPGAGFAETARYQSLTPDRYPPIYEQMLWGVYDVPGYTRNLFNLPVVAYSGELDKQIQAARVMEEAFQREGRSLPHRIGPGMGHAYHPDTLRGLLATLAEAASAGKQPLTSFSIQTKHPRYAAWSWLGIDGFAEQYADTRAEVQLREPGMWTVHTRNATRLHIDGVRAARQAESLTVDGDPIALEKQTLLLQKSVNGRWRRVAEFPVVRKRPGLSGPIDDAFLEPFLVVLPTGRAAHPRVEQWVQCELKNFQERWRALFRGQPRMKLDVDVMPGDMEQYHLIVWGDPKSNRILNRIASGRPSNQRTADIPWTWDPNHVAMGDQKFAADSHVLLAIHPNPMAPGRYLVLNSGPTFRQAHDRTNSLQNPHLPDWAVIGLGEPPSAERPGAVVRTGFFDDAWKYTPELSF